MTQTVIHMFLYTISPIGPFIGTVHTQTHARRQIDIQFERQNHTDTVMQTDGHKQNCGQTQTQTQTQIQIQTQTQTQAQTHTDTCTGTDTDTQTHRHTDTQAPRHTDAQIEFKTTPTPKR